MDGKAHTDYLAALARVPAGNTIELRLGNTSDGTIVLPQKLPAMLEPEPEPELVYTPDVPSAIPLQQQPGRSDSSSVSAADDHRTRRSSSPSATAAPPYSKGSPGRRRLDSSSERPRLRARSVSSAVDGRSGPTKPLPGRSWSNPSTSRGPADESSPRCASPGRKSKKSGAAKERGQRQPSPPASPREQLVASFEEPGSLGLDFVVSKSPTGRGDCVVIAEMHSGSQAMRHAGLRPGLVLIGVGGVNVRELPFDVVRACLVNGGRPLELRFASLAGAAVDDSEQWLDASVSSSDRTGVNYKGRVGSPSRSRSSSGGRAASGPKDTWDEITVEFLDEGPLGLVFTSAAANGEPLLLTRIVNGRLGSREQTLVAAHRRGAGFNRRQVIAMHRPVRVTSLTVSGASCGRM